MHRFIVPDLESPITGGTLYDRCLMAAANAAGCACTAVPIDEAKTALARAAPGDCFWVDSLFLDRVSDLVSRAAPGARVGLLAHYLPALLARGDELGRGELTGAEADALACAPRFLVPSGFMAGLIRRLIGPGRPILCIEPGRLATVCRAPPPGPMRAAMVANLVPNKGVAAFLASLAEQIRADDDFCMTIVGGFALDPSYARLCRQRGSDPRLAGRIHFTGQLSPAAALAVLAQSNLFVSASVMESYGMALAEARTLGLAIVARAGGNVAGLVAPASGGELCHGPEDLASACLGLARDPAEHRRRAALARALALPPRPWAQAGREFAAATAGVLDETAPPPPRPDSEGALATRA